MSVEMKPQEVWEEPHIGEFVDSPTHRVYRAALMNPDTKRRIAMLLSANPSGMPVTLSYRTGHSPEWIQAGSSVRCQLEEIQAHVLRCSLPRRSYPLDIYWEELEWIEVGSRLPSVE